MYGIYVRVSTEDQAKKGYSIPDQLESCRALVPKGEAYKEYIDDITGELMDRPALNQLREDARDGLITHVLCFDPDRWSRKLLVQLLVTSELEKLGIIIQFVNSNYENTPEGRMFFQMRGAIAEFEKAKILLRTSRGRRTKAKEGKVLRDFQLYGYDYDHEKEIFIINEQEAEIVREVFNLFTEPNDLGIEGINGIAKYLTARGIPTKRSAKVWHRQVVRQMLMNSAYKGEFYANRWNTDGMGINKYLPPDQRIKMTERPQEEWILIKIPAIVTPEQFERAQDLIEKARRLWAGRQNYRYLLSGLVRCGGCGNTMTGRNAKNWGKHVREYTCVKNYSGAKNTGCGNRIPSEYVDNYVWNQVKAWVSQPQEIAAALEAPSNEEFYQKELERYWREIEKKKEGRKKLLDLLLETDLDTEEVRERLRDLKKREEELMEKISQIEKRLEVEKNNEFRQRQIESVIGLYLSKNIDELEIEDKQMLVRHLIERVVINTNKQIYIYTV